MIYLFTAMYCEARTLIEYFHLKKDIGHTRFQVFYNEDAGICLTVTGTGNIPGAVAVSSICTEYHAGSGDFLVNIGICAGIAETDTVSRQKSSGIGEIFLGNKIVEETTGKTFYPDMLYRHKFAEAQIVTGAGPFYGTKSEDRKDFFLYDMEAASIYQAGNYFLGPHQMSFLKIVSDYGDGKEVTPEQVRLQVASHIERIADYLKRLRTIAQMEKQKEIKMGDEAEKTAAKLCHDMHCSKVMSASVVQYIRYCALSGIDYASVVDRMYLEHKLPCRDKREGKRCFEEFKRRLL